MSTDHKPTTEPTAATTAPGATGRENVAPAPPPMRRHTETGFECSCPNGPCPTMDRHIDERMFLRDQKYGDPWARPAADVAEQRHVELLAAILHAPAATDKKLECVYSTVADALEGAREIIRQNRRGKR